MLRILASAAALALSLASARAPAWGGEIAGPCKQDAHGTYVCGEGDRALRVIEGSLSPSKALGIAWRPLPGKEQNVEVREDDGLHFGEFGEAENVLVRLSDGAVLAVLSGAHHGDAQDLNHTHHQAAWSPDSTLLAEAGSGKWMLELLDLRALGTDGTVSERAGLLELVTKAAIAALKKANKRANPDDYVLDIIEKPGVRVDRAGVVSVPVVLQIMKTDTYYEFEVKLATAVRGGKISAKVRSVRRLESGE